MCDYRIIYKNILYAYSSIIYGSWGKMNELEEEMENLKDFNE